MTRLINLALLVLLGTVGCDVPTPGTSSNETRNQTWAGNAGPLIKWHYVGASSLAGNTNAWRLKKVLAEPSTQRLLDDLISKFAQCSTNLAPEPVRSGARNPAQLVVPLIRDLLDYHSIGTLATDADSRSVRLELAINLPPEQATRWLRNWADIMTALGSTQPSEIEHDGFKGFETKWTGTPGGSRVLKAGNWVVLTLGARLQEVPTPWLQRIKLSGQPAEPPREAWLSVEADLDRIAHLLNFPHTIQWPNMVSLEFFGRGPNLRTVGRFTFAKPLNLRIEPWHIPTNTISEPLVSFTAIQGIRPWLAAQTWIKESGIASVPNQIFAWGQAHVPFQTYLTWEMPDMANSLPKLATSLFSLATNNLFWTRHAFLGQETNKLKYVWHRLPMVSPFLEQAAPPDTQFVVAGVFPRSPRVQPAPHDLYSQIIGRTNLLYYDWELSQVRVDDWRRMKELYWMIGGYEIPATNTPVRLWLADTNVYRHLDNAVTEITCISPTELGLTRSSSIGFTSLELVLFSRWIEDPQFPKVSRPRWNPILTRISMQDRPSSAETKPTQPSAQSGANAPPNPTPNQKY
ncbi:MAG: hypothetical protein N3G20_08845 [Verrucomicrobiae bacterium]|nr:hypothetical protein [Verrucomicrobiae bacterium]